YVRLYADEACTILYSTPVDKHIELLYAENFNGIGRSNKVTATVRPGNSAVLIKTGLLSREYRVEWGNVVKNEFRRYEGHNGFFRN
ncbi:MAG: hypothetical protein WCF67_07560, partial [Chitinophagaceae bacterium]